MDDIDDFITLVRDEIGLPVTRENVGAHFDELAEWDSVHLLTLLTAVERETRHPVSLPRMMEATSLEQIYQLATAGR
jgi:acyl carrier protein